ncbi:MAG: hypothetical protein AAB587_00875, partial [Patescibacteria group bacterium]
ILIFSIVLTGQLYSMDESQSALPAKVSAGAEISPGLEMSHDFSRLTAMNAMNNDAMIAGDLAEKRMSDSDVRQLTPDNIPLLAEDRQITYDNYRDVFSNAQIRNVGRQGSVFSVQSYSVLQQAIYSQGAGGLFAFSFSGAPRLI